MKKVYVLFAMLILTLCFAISVYAASDAEIGQKAQVILNDATVPGANGAYIWEWNQLNIDKVENGIVYLSGTLLFKSQVQMVEHRVCTQAGAKRVSMFHVNYLENDNTNDGRDTK